MAALARRLNRATDENVRRDLAALPGMIDRVDELIEQGVIGGPERNAADYQIATSVSLLLTMDDIRPMIEGRPAERLARDVVAAPAGPHAAASTRPDARSVGTPSYARQSPWKQPLHSGSRTSA